MNEQESQKALGEMRERIHQDVAAGFLNEEEICDGVRDMLADRQTPDELLAQVERLTREALEAHFLEQANWPAKTDCDRLVAAFSDLEQAGIVARENFSCCCNCGSSEIWDEVKNVEEDGQQVRGFTFFHMQDTERAVEGQGVYLSYGAVKEGEAPALEIARKVATTIQRHGLVVDWDGTWNKRIGVRLDWKRKRDPSQPRVT